jgi:uncharacterized protein (DUF1778 family)
MPRAATKPAEYAERRKAYPRAQKPVLIGLTSGEHATLTQAAEICETPRSTFIRDAALYHAEKIISKAGK